MAIRERRIQEKEKVKCERRAHAPPLSSFFTKSDRMRPFAASAPASRWAFSALYNKKKMEFLFFYGGIFFLK